ARGQSGGRALHDGEGGAGEEPREQRLKREVGEGVQGTARPRKPCCSRIAAMVPSPDSAAIASSTWDLTKVLSASVMPPTPIQGSLTTGASRTASSASSGRCWLRYHHQGSHTIRAPTTPFIRASKASSGRPTGARCQRSAAGSELL